jgi:hypothetical protein
MTLRFSRFLSRHLPFYETLRHRHRMYRIRKHLVRYAKKPLQ